MINMSSSDTTLARGLTGTKLIGAHKDKRVFLMFRAFPLEAR
jgi:hypothetical protein